MKKVIFSMLVLSAVMFAGEDVKAQQFKVAVFDIDYMVQAMPGYAAVDSLLQIYQQDSLTTEYNIYQSEYQRLDSTFKSDSAAGKAKAILDYTAGKRQEMAMNLVYWQQIAQRKSEAKRGQLAQPLYVQVANAYQKVLETKKYALILKPQTYEFGFPIDNLFISVAKELKLTSLPQELLQVGDDPDAKTAPAGTKPPATGAKPKTN
ncbi:OmpH family outer membrane protein [Panacibacter ginsenosidivorans]|uniref:OmpH family outer membrane protein n=1 Tax=Panacibacter ginsenosidivorans TaxID=1813871 RepID=A0A5B8V8Z5_9BACT|nr:OmpH family outer membrane protein [Panacibacter ginsenosidivorans]QEC67977.1 OmpH family outer membrane protein [Panacibacter ginsenosidivorans]